MKINLFIAVKWTYWANLMKSVSEWNEADFELFVRANSIIFRAFVRRYVNDFSMGEDIIQDTLFKLWSDRKKINPTIDLNNYVLTMIKNSALNKLKRDTKLSFVDTYLKDDGDGVDFTNNIIAAEAHDMVIKAIEGMSTDYCKILKMTLDGYKNDEIAQEMDMSLDSVKSIKKRAIKRLQNLTHPDALVIVLIITLRL